MKTLRFFPIFLKAYSPLAYPPTLNSITGIIIGNSILENIVTIKVGPWNIATLSKYIFKKTPLINKSNFMPKNILNITIDKQFYCMYNFWWLCNYSWLKKISQMWQCLSYVNLLLFGTWLRVVNVIHRLPKWKVRFSFQYYFS